MANALMMMFSLVIVRFTRAEASAERVNEAAKARDPNAEAKTYKDQVRGTDEQAKHAVATPPPPPTALPSAA